MTVLAAAAEISGWSSAAIATLVSVAVSSLIALLGLYLAGVRQERARRRDLYAKALAAALAYQEFPFVIRRRRADASGEERVRISEALRAVQHEIAYSQTWMEAEARGAAVAEAYDRLVGETRRIAGGYMTDAWSAAPLDNDAGMNVTGIDFSALEAPRAAYLQAVKQRLRRWW